MDLTKRFSCRSKEIYRTFLKQAVKQILFFSTPADITPALRRFEANAPLKFVPTGMRATSNRPVYLSSPEIPQKGVSTHETGHLSIRYMVSHRETKNRMYTFKDDTGQQRWLLSNRENEEAVQLTMAGLWTTGSLLPGVMNTLHETPVAQELMCWFLSSLQQEAFERVGVYWLGREALDMLKAGKRLVQAEQSPPEYDLKWSDVG